MPTRPQPRNFAAPENLAGPNFECDTSVPGVFPFTRGVQPDMYRGRAWTMRLDAGFATGGAPVAVETGYIQQQIQDAAYRAQQAIDAGEAVVVGVNRFVQRDEEATDRPSADVRLDPELKRQQIDRVRALRAGRSRQEWRGPLAGVEQAARDGSNLVPPIIVAVEAHVTVGEVADALRRVFGDYQGVGTT